MAISKLTIPARTAASSTGYASDMNLVIAKINELATSMAVSPLTIAAAVGAGNPAADMNLVVAKINELIGGGTTPPTGTKATAAVFGTIDDTNNLVGVTSNYPYTEVIVGLEGQAGQQLASNSIFSPGNVAGRAFAYVVANSTLNRLQSDTVYSAPFTMAAASNTAPTASISVVDNIATVTPGQSVILQLSGADSDAGDAITKIEALDNGVKIGEITGASGSLQTPALTAGTHSFTARAYDTKGATGLSTAVLVTAKVATSTQVLDFSDNSNGFRYAPYTEQKSGWVQRSDAAQVVIETNCTGLKVIVQNYGNGSNGTTIEPSYPQTEVGMRINNVRKTPLRGPVSNSFQSVVPVFYTHELTLPGGTNQIELTEGTTVFIDRFISNVSIVRIEGTGGDLLRVVPLVRRPYRMLMNLDSIGISANNRGPASYGLVTLAREDSDFAQWEFATGDSGAGAYDEVSHGTAAKQQAHVAMGVNWLTGATVPMYFSEAITNSWGNHSSPSAFYNVKAAIADAFRTAMPTCKQMYQTAFARANGGNNQGYTLQQFSDVLANLVSARPQYAVRFDASNVITTNDLRDGVHPTDDAEALKIYPQWKAWWLANATAAVGSGVPAAVFTPLGDELVVGPTIVQNNELNRKAGSGYTIVYRPSIDVPGSSGAATGSSNADVTVAYAGDPYQGEISYNINSQAMEITTIDEVFVGTGLEIYAPMYSEGAKWELVVDGQVVDAGTAQGTQTATKLMAKVYNLPDGRHTWKYRMVDYAPDRKYLMLDYVKIIRREV